MAANARITVMLPFELLDGLTKIADERGISVSALVRAAAEREFGHLAQPDPDIVEFLLRPGDPAEPASWSNGGRWLLDWLVRREPDWQKHHLCIFPRHWPLPVDGSEARCWSNGGDPRSVNDHLRELVEDRRFPSGCERITPEQWAIVTARYKACCGERLRAPSGAHWGVCA